MTNKLTATEQYLRNLQVSTGSEDAIVDVTAPSGNVFKFRRPSKFTMLFHHGRMPQAAANSAVQSWIDAGVIKPGEAAANEVQQFQEVLRLRDRVLELSVFPKLVVGDAVNDDELSTDHLSDEDSEFLFKWVANGGVEVGGLSTFPVGSRTGSTASPNRKKRRSATKRTSGHNG